MNGLRYIEGVATLTLDEARCTGCGVCLEVCPHAVFALDRAPVSIVDRDACMECGACAINCSAGALSVEAGVGCASAILKGWLTRSEPTCGCATVPTGPDGKSSECAGACEDGGSNCRA
jgi:NAD-dependent dihydropyrimidine dehydrogenase PreA subunit